MKYLIIFLIVLMSGCGRTETLRFGAAGYQDLIEERVICGGGYTDKDGISWGWNCPNNAPCFIGECKYRPFVNEENYANPQYPSDRPAWSECYKGAKKEYERLKKEKKYEKR